MDPVVQDVSSVTGDMVSGNVMTAVETRTGQLFSDLWHRYDDEAFKHSVSLFEKRWLANGEDATYFADKKCLDAGCGGGRNSIAMALLGASEVVGVDVGTGGLEDAQARAHAVGLTHVTFKEASVLDLPFPDESFDFVMCSGVLHHTRSVERGLRELHRVLKPGGSSFLLLYGAGGLYWPLNLVMRSYASALGLTEVDRAVSAAGFSAAKRRTILDDLFVPILETYTTDRVHSLLEQAGFSSHRRWRQAQLDHESDPKRLVMELEERAQLWTAGAASAPTLELARLERHLAEICNHTVISARELIGWNAAGQLTDEELRRAVIGEGHHRIIVDKTAHTRSAR